MQKKPNDFGLKYGNEKNNEKAEWINNKIRELVGLKEGLKEGIHIDLFKTTLKNIYLENPRLWWNTWFLVQEIRLTTE